MVDPPQSKLLEIGPNVNERQDVGHGSTCCTSSACTRLASLSPTRKAKMVLVRRQIAFSVPPCCIAPCSSAVLLGCEPSWISLTIFLRKGEEWIRHGEELRQGRVRSVRRSGDSEAMLCYDRKHTRRARRHHALKVGISTKDLEFR